MHSLSPVRTLLPRPDRIGRALAQARAAAITSHLHISELPRINRFQEHGGAVPDVSPQARKIAAKLNPEPTDLSLTRIDESESWAEAQDYSPSPPPAGYIGPYPMRRARQSEET
jgi:hypothetical protein